MKPGASLDPHFIIISYGIDFRFEISMQYYP